MKPEQQERIADAMQAAYEAALSGPSRWLWFALAVVALVTTGWALRFEYIPHANPTFHRINRWTGEVVFCHANGCDTAPDAPPTPP